MERIAHSLPTGRTQRKSFFVRMLHALLRWDARYKQGRALENLDNHMRRDVGLPEVEESKWIPPTVMRM